MRRVQDDRRRRLADLAALDADEPVLDVVDPPDTVLAAEVVQPLDQLDEPSRSPSMDTGCPLEADHDLDGAGASPAATVHS